ncbi:MAG: hypothetical protein HYS04_04065 [Acidobacteria bacterium]|nr:hypothetical protein [Acidobacteriota bacterium]
MLSWKQLVLFAGMPIAFAAVWALRSPAPQTGAAELGVAEVAGHRWVVLARAGEAPVRLHRIAGGDDVRRLSWSPGRRCFAFEIFDAAGPSPARVYAGAPGEPPSELRWPGPEPFSTRFERWDGPNVLRVRVTALSLPGDKFYDYDCAAGRLSGPVR